MGRMGPPQPKAPKLGPKHRLDDSIGLADPRVQSVGVSFLRAAVRDSNGTTKDILQNLGVDLSVSSGIHQDPVQALRLEKVLRFRSLQKGVSGI